jgi:hypothetical protein
MNSRSRRKHNKEKKAANSHNSENIKEILERALDEEEFDDEEELPSEEVITPKQHSSRKAFFILGIFILIMSVVGIFSTVQFITKQAEYFADNTAQKNEFADFIYPIVICDPPPFDKTVKMRNETIISAAIWDIILYEDKSVYPQEFDYIIVPELTVERHAAKLFGDGLAITNQSVIGTDLQFYYDEMLKSYRIPASPRYFTYSPYIESITKVGERYTLLVGYLSPTPSWYTMTEKTPEPEKYAEYVVSKRGDTMQLVAISRVESIGNQEGL